MAQHAPKKTHLFFTFCHEGRRVWGWAFLDLDVPLMFQIIPSDIPQDVLDNITFKPISFAQKLNLSNLGNWILIWNFGLVCSHCFVLFYPLLFVFIILQESMWWCHGWSSKRYFKITFVIMLIHLVQEIIHDKCLGICRLFELDINNQLQVFSYVCFITSKYYVLWFKHIVTKFGSLGEA